MDETSRQGVAIFVQRDGFVQPLQGAHRHHATLTLQHAVHGRRTALARGRFNCRQIRRRCREAADLTRIQLHAFGVEHHGVTREQIVSHAFGEGRGGVGDRLTLLPIEVRQDEKRRVASAFTQDRQDIAAAMLQLFERGGCAKERMAPQDCIEATNQVTRIICRTPIEATATMDVNLFTGIPFHTRRDTKGTLLREQCREGETQTCIRRRGRCQTVVVVRFSKVNQGTALFREAQHLGQHRFEGRTVIGLEHFRVGPVQTRLANQGLRDIHRTTQTFQKEDRVRIFAAHQGHNHIPRRLRNHVTGIATEPVHTLTAPVEEDIGDCAAQFRLRVIQFHQIFPRYAPSTRRMERAIGILAVPFGMVNLEGCRPTRVVRGQIHEERSPTRMHRTHQFVELVQRRCRDVKFC